MTQFKRLLKLQLPPHQSAFLWGARKTGKTTYLKQHFKEAIFYDLLQSDEYVRLLKAPHLLRQEIVELKPNQIRQPIIIDEIQKIPALLDEVHWCIENTRAQFILCGSSARKLKALGSNLLGGRAWRFMMQPLVYQEVKGFDLLRALNTGLIPDHYLSPSYPQALESYLLDYITHEVQAEGLTRNLPAFARFLDSIIYNHGGLVNFSNIARDCAIDAKTVREYYQILVDTLLGYWLLPYHGHKKRDEIAATPKFYLLDVGLATFMAKRTIRVLKGIEAGQAFEHYIFMELMAYLSYTKCQMNLYFWRTKYGHEVDFILGKGEIAIEVKIASDPEAKDIKNLTAFCEIYKPCHKLVVCNAPRPRQLTLSGHKIRMLPWQLFLEELWNNHYV